MKAIAEILRADAIRDIPPLPKPEVLETLCSMVAGQPEVLDETLLCRSITAREHLMSTGIGMGVALPHARTPAVTDYVMAMCRCREGLEFESLDNEPTYIVILMCAPERNRAEFLDFISKIGSLFNADDFKDRVMNATDIEALHSLMTSRL